MGYRDGVPFAHERRIAEVAIVYAQALIVTDALERTECVALGKSTGIVFKF